MVAICSFCEKDQACPELLCLGKGERNENVVEIPSPALSSPSVESASLLPNHSPCQGTLDFTHDYHDIIMKSLSHTIIIINTNLIDFITWTYI